MGATRIELRNVSKRFGQVAALDNVTFSVEPGTLVALLGPSGCGKTTTLRLIAGLDFPTSGTIVIGDADVSALSPAERSVAMVTPVPALPRHMTVLEIVAEGGRAAGSPPADADARARTMLETVDLAALAARLPSELSSGQAQRVAIARALVREPAVLLFDEPLASLDAALRRHVRDEIRALQQRLGITAVYVTHDHEEAGAIADDVLRMERGRVTRVTGDAGHRDAASPLEPADPLDAADPLRGLRDRFTLPHGVIYLDGNSLGALPRATAARVAEVVEREWGDGLIRSWNAAGWIDLPRRVGDKVARLIGARAGEVIVADSTSVNLFKMLTGALALNPRRRVILTEADNFPTDVYVAEGVAALLGAELRRAPGDEIAAALDERVAVVALTHVSYRTGRMHDLARVTARAHEAGALVLWDLAHSAGAMPLDLNGCGVDLAVGCGYKYLNGGPGAPAFLFIAARHQAAFRSPLSGWMGHAEPFAFAPSYRPADGIARALVGTPPILSLAALEVGVDLALEADLDEVRRKSIALSERFITLVARDCAGLDLRLASPRDADGRGSQVCFAHPEGYAIVQALIARGVIGDFRAPDILRFGFAPLYTRFADVAAAVRHLRSVLEHREWDRPEYRERATVT
jgi:kynureninase